MFKNTPADTHIAHAMGAVQLDRHDMRQVDDDTAHLRSVRTDSDSFSLTCLLFRDAPHRNVLQLGAAALCLFLRGTALIRFGRHPTESSRAPAVSHTLQYLP